MPNELHLYTDDCDGVIAASPEDARKAWEEFTGVEANPDTDWEPVPDERTIGIWCDESGEPTEIGCGTLVKRTAAEWVVLRGRGYLYSSESPESTPADEERER